MIDWSQVEVGDVVEFRNKSREAVFECHAIGCMKFPVVVNCQRYTTEGRIDEREEHEFDIVAIHKPGTVGALSHEERSRLWDKCEEYDIGLSTNDDELWEAWDFTHSERAATRLEAVMKCVAAIEADKKEAGNVN